VNGHVLKEIYVGRAYERQGGGDGAAYDSVDLRNFYMDGDRILAAFAFTRSSTEPEGADMDPPQLDGETWAADLDHTLGFLSRDGGRVWERLYVSTTFEGIEWGIERLDRDTPLLWDFYLYTRH
jgi:hypothetical protein